MSVRLLHAILWRGIIRLEQSGKRATGAWVWLVSSVCMLVTSGCLGHRMSAVEVVQHVQASLQEAQACHSILSLDIDTDLLKESVLLEVWEQGTESLKVSVLSAVNPQLRGMAFTTDGKQSMSYSPHANQVLVGPADRVKLPVVLARLVESRTDWIRQADPEDAAIVAKKREEGLVLYEVQIPLSASGFAVYSVDARQWRIWQIVYEDDYLGKGQIDVREMACVPEFADAQFLLDLPSGVPITEVSMADSRPLTIEEAQMAVPFPLQLPVYLPEGTRFEAAYQRDENVAMMYAGERSFTLVQGPDIGQVPQEQATVVPLRGQPAMLSPDPEREGWMLTWRKDGLQFSVAGSLGQDEIFRIAESLELASKSAENDRDDGRATDQGR